MLPLYDSGAHAIPSGEDAVRQISQLGANRGLWFERFFNQYNEAYEVKDTAKNTFIKGVTGKCGNEEALRHSYVRQSTLVEACGGRSITLSADWHFATGLGNPHPVENGFLFHPTLAAPYLPGSSVKGLVRSWLEQQLGEQAEARALFHRLFGSEDKNPSQCVKDTQAGDVIFFDALPVMPATLVLDVMTPHMGGWYEKGGTPDASQAANQPADWHDPIPVPFLAAKELVLRFSVAPRKACDDAEDLIALVLKALRSALYHAGAGAKTAAGYGGFSELDEVVASQLGQLDKQLANALGERREEQRKEAKLARMSLEAQLIEGLRDDATKRENQKPEQAGPFINRLRDALESAQSWPDAEKAALLDFYGSYKQYLSKKRAPELKSLVSKLRGIQG
jgi:CRISPR-associated protein Cmr6